MNNNSQKDENTSSSKADWLADKEHQAERRRLERALSEIEETIEKLETEIAAIDEQLSDPAVGTDLPKLQELSKKREDADASLTEAMTKWESVSDELEAMEVN